jgi:hypothetical protein
VYLNDVDDVSAGAGATAFRELDLRVAPRKGMALLFFPAFAAAGVLGSDGAKATKAAAAEAARVGAVADASRGALASPPGGAKPARAKATAKKTKGDGAAGAAVDVALEVAAGQGDFRTLHCGSPTVAGTKWVAQVWAHARPYEPKVPPGNAH